MSDAYVVEIGSKLHGPFPSKEDAQEWVSQRAVRFSESRQIVVYSVRKLRPVVPSGCFPRD